MLGVFLGFCKNVCVLWVGWGSTFLCNHQSLKAWICSHINLSLTWEEVDYKYKTPWTSYRNRRRLVPVINKCGTQICLQPSYQLIHWHLAKGHFTHKARAVTMSLWGPLILIQRPYHWYGMTNFTLGLSLGSELNANSTRPWNIINNLPCRNPRGLFIHDNFFGS